MQNCHTMPAVALNSGQRIALVGNPNVGKSLFFHRLTGTYVVVSNYPGTTVELSQGTAKSLGHATVVDTPGIVAFPPRTDDEAVTARVILRESFRAVLQVGDAKNFRRTLLLTAQLAELGVPLVLALNMMDEAQAHGLQVDVERLSQILGLTVVPTIATRGTGVADVERALEQARPAALELCYPAELEDALEKMQPLFPESTTSSRGLGLLWLSGDEVVDSWLREAARPEDFQALERIRRELKADLAQSPEIVIQQVHNDWVDRVCQQVLHQKKQEGVGFAARLSRITIHPLWGLPVLALVLYGMYWFVGVFGAGTLVGLLEEDLFSGIVNPWVTAAIERLIPIPFLVDMLVGEYGLWTMGMTYAVALLLPIVTTFFIAFGVLEDSGYLPRLAVLTNKIFRMLGLNGKAVLPMVLGLGCVTMATLTTRILTSKRDRLLVIFLLALAIPCSAQLGVVLGMLSAISASAALIWFGLMIGVLLLVGWLAAKLLPGERTPLVVELPPLRLPVLSNVVMKTLARLEWYVKEAVPLFLIGTLLLFVLDKIHVLPWLIQAGEPLVTGWLGLPAEASSAFLLGFLRRDFAATGLFAMQETIGLTNLQVLVAIVTITLFVPCIASTFMIIKERGVKTTAAMLAFIFPFAFLVGGLLYRVLTFLGWGA
ncbi:MAG TPA: ferrous iron transport protein B [Chloroflexi bacterium]|nr:ferrous iron transport protein B [Chloroflexota bacterium]